MDQPTNLWAVTGQYPSDEILEYIEQFDCANEDVEQLLALIKEIWWRPDYGFIRNGEDLQLHTGGWSGNESIIEALQANELFFLAYWQKSERGGHYYFKIKLPPHDSTTPR